MVTIRQERTADASAREALLDAAYPVRFTKPSERLRAGRKPARRLALVAVEDGQKNSRLVGTVRLWEVSVGANRPALLLGPLAVEPSRHNQGIGTALMQRALAEAGRHGHRVVLLVGDAAYYDRFGFSAERAASLWLPGLAEKHRLLGLELTPGALVHARGAIRAPRRTARTPLAVAALAAPLTPKAA